MGARQKRGKFQVCCHPSNSKMDSPCCCSQLHAYLISKHRFPQETAELERRDSGDSAYFWCCVASYTLQWRRLEYTEWIACQSAQQLVTFIGNGFWSVACLCYKFNRGVQLSTATELCLSVPQNWLNPYLSHCFTRLCIFRCIDSCWWVRHAIIVMVLGKTGAVILMSMLLNSVHEFHNLSCMYTGCHSSFQYLSVSYILSSCLRQTHCTLGNFFEKFLNLWISPNICQNSDINRLWCWNLWYIFSEYPFNGHLSAITQSLVYYSCGDFRWCKDHVCIRLRESLWLIRCTVSTII